MDTFQESTTTSRHPAAEATLTSVGRQVEPDTTTLGVIIDAPDDTRARAVGDLSEHRSPDQAELQRRRSRFDASFEVLRFAASRHALIPRQPDRLDDLWRSRAELDRLRLDVARRRREAFDDVIGSVATSA